MAFLLTIVAVGSFCLGLLTAALVHAARPSILRERIAEMERCKACPDHEKFLCDCFNPLNEKT